LVSILPDMKSDCIIKKPLDNTQIINTVRRVIKLVK
jgi:hypothetical protein